MTTPNPAETLREIVTEAKAQADWEREEDRKYWRELDPALLDTPYPGSTREETYREMRDRVAVEHAAVEPAVHYLDWLLTLPPALAEIEADAIAAWKTGRDIDPLDLVTEIGNLLEGRPRLSESDT